MKTSIMSGFTIFLVAALCTVSLAAGQMKLIPVDTRSTATQPTSEPLQQPAQSAQPLPQEAPLAAPQTAPQLPEKLSEFEDYIAGKIPADVSVNLRQFGYDLFFRQPPDTFAPVQNVPVGPDYVIGPGDELRITVWGKIEGAWNTVVDRDGTISLPKIGVLGVTGLTFRELKDLLLKEFSKYYTGFEMNVSIGSLRTIRIYVVGNAQRPGAYTISSISTLVNALFETGGPAKTGTMRDIQVKRNGQTIVHFDLYDFLLRGDKTNDIRLMPEDVVFIPAIGPIAAIAGSVMNPAIYELKGQTTVSRLIEMAGGLSTVAFTGRIQIDRIIDMTRQTVFESSLDDIRKQDLSVQSGDVVKVFQVVQDKRTVRITGAVHRQGEYGFKKGMTVKDLVSMAGGLLYYAYDKEAELTRVTVTDRGPETEKIFIQLSKALAGEPNDNLPLSENDYLFIRAVPEWDLYKTVSILGEVRFPGTYTIRKGERLSSLVARAGGITDKAYPQGAVFTRQSIMGLQQQQINEMVDRLELELLSVGTAQVATAETADEAKIFQMEAAQKRQFIQRLRTVRAKGRISINLAPAEKLKETPFDIELEDGDSLSIPSDPKTVQVIGSVYNQNAFVFEKGKAYQHYLTLAGGLTGNADEDNIYILKANGIALKIEDISTGLAWNSDKLRWETGGAVVASGDTVVVPEKLERIAWMRNIKDITQILFQIAVSAGVVIAAF
ncbi:MAG: SLBB domain-containing protein [bacterium]